MSHDVSRLKFTTDESLITPAIILITGHFSNFGEIPW